MLRTRGLQLLDAKVRLISVGRPHLERGLHVDCAFAEPVELNRDSSSDLVSVLGLNCLLVVLLPIAG